MSKTDQKIIEYKEIMDNMGFSYDDALFEKITRDLGPANFHSDARYVATSDPKEVKTVKQNFLMHKLGLEDGQYLDDAIAAVAVKMGMSNRQKHRAIFYYLLMQELNVDQPEPDHPPAPVSGRDSPTGSTGSGRDSPGSGRDSPTESEKREAEHNAKGEAVLSGGKKESDPLKTTAEEGDAAAEDEEDASHNPDLCSRILAHFKLLASGSKLMWRMLLCSFFYTFLIFEETDIFLAYLRTTISCDNENTTEPLREWGNWSGSEHCFQRNYVIEQATVSLGWLTTLSTLLKVPALIILGVIADSCGRKPVLTFGVACIAVTFGLLAANKFIDGGTTLYLVAVAQGLQGFSNPVAGGQSPFFNAMVADLATKDLGQRGIFMTLYAVVRTLGLLMGFSVGFSLLYLKLYDYMVVWLIFAGIAALCTIMFCVVLKETLVKTDETDDKPSSGEKDSTGALKYGTEDTDGAGTGGDDEGEDTGDASASTCSNAVLKPIRGFGMVFRSPFLCVFLFLVSASYFAFTGLSLVFPSFMMSTRDMDQALASTFTIVQTVTTVIGYGLNTWVTSKVKGQAYTSFLLGTSLSAVATLILGLVAPFTDVGAWFAILLQGLAYGFLLPAWPAIASIFVTKEAQGQLMACFYIAILVSMAVSAEVYSLFLFDANAVGFRAGLPFIVTSGILVMVVIVFSIVLCCTNLRSRALSTVNPKTQKPPVTSKVE